MKTGIITKVVGIADSTEPMRKDPNLNRIRDILQTDLDTAYLEKHIYSMRKVMESHHFLDSEKAAVYNYLICEREITKKDYE